MQSGVFSDSFEPFLLVNRIHILLMKTFLLMEIFFKPGNTVGEKRNPLNRGTITGYDNCLESWSSGIVVEL